MNRKPYHRPINRHTWYMGHVRYQKYMLREVTSLLIFAYSLELVIGLWRLSQGPEAWAGFLGWLNSPLGVAFHLIVLGFTLYHTVSWFNVTPKAMPLRMGEERVPGSVIVGAHYGAWVAVSVVVLIIAAFIGG
jgi:fumarate reductase subunit C